MLAERIMTDVLVIGGGGAAFRAAIAAREQGADCLLVSKGPLARCGATPMAGADYTVDGATLHRLGFPGAPQDSPEQFYNDIVHQGFFLNNQKLLQQYVTNAPARLEELLAWGVKPRKTEERAIYTTGLELMDVLLRRAQGLGVRFFSDVMMLDLVVRDGQVIGAVGLEVKSGKIMSISAKAVVLATGGWHKAWWPTTGSRDLSGDGMAMALRAGASLGNMEFVTFACPILLSPPHCQGSLATYIMILAAGGRLTNALGDEYLHKYDPFTVERGSYMEWNKLFLSLTADIEVRAGKGSPSGGVYYDRGSVPWEQFEAAVTGSMPRWKYKALDLSALAEVLKQGGSLEVGGVAEYFEGGIVIDETFSSEIPGLFAAGECSLGPWGANRVCSAITEIMVQGADAGRNAARHATDRPTLSLNPGECEAIAQPALGILELTGGPRPAVVRRQLQEKAQTHLGPVRHGAELKALLHWLEDLKKQELPALCPASNHRVYNKDWLDALELANMTLLLESAARSALMRTESRGVHYREDFPQTDNDAWLLEILVADQGGEIQIRTRPPEMQSLRPSGGIVPYFDMLKSMIAAHAAVGGHH